MRPNTLILQTDNPDDYVLAMSISIAGSSFDTTNVMSVPLKSNY
jgi:hypothetical protein